MNGCHRRYPLPREREVRINGIRGRRAPQSPGTLSQAPCRWSVHALNKGERLFSVRWIDIFVLVCTVFPNPPSPQARSGRARRRACPGAVPRHMPVKRPSAADQCGRALWLWCRGDGDAPGIVPRRFPRATACGGTEALRTAPRFLTKWSRFPSRSTDWGEGRGVTPPASSRETVLSSDRPRITGHSVRPAPRTTRTQ